MLKSDLFFYIMLVKKNLIKKIIKKISYLPTLIFFQQGKRKHNVNFFRPCKHEQL